MDCYGKTFGLNKYNKELEEKKSPLEKQYNFISSLYRGCKDKKHQIEIITTMTKSTDYQIARLLNNHGYDDEVIQSILKKGE